MNDKNNDNDDNNYVKVGEGRPGDCLLQIFSTPLFNENTFFLEVWVVIIVGLKLGLNLIYRRQGVKRT